MELRKVVVLNYPSTGKQNYWERSWFLLFLYDTRVHATFTK